MVRKAKPKPVPTIAVDRETVKRITAAILHVDGEIAELKQDRKAYTTEAREAQIHAQAHTLAIRLAKMTASDRWLWLECFDDLRVKLELDQAQTASDPQGDLRDVVKAKAA